MALLAGLEPASSVIRRLSVPRLAKTPPPARDRFGRAVRRFSKIKLRDRVVHAPGVAPGPSSYQDAALLLRHAWMVEMAALQPHPQQRVLSLDDVVTQHCARRAGAARGRRPRHHVETMHPQNTRPSSPAVRRPPSPHIPTGQRWDGLRIARSPA